MSRQWSPRSLRALHGIHPDLRRVMDRALRESPLDFIVIEGLRTVERQRELVAEGASKTMNSRHITGHAVDILPIGTDGKPRFDWPLYHKVAPAVKAAALAEGVALVWGGDWRSFPDGPHFELDRDVYPASVAAVPPKPKDRPAVTATVAASAASTVAAGVPAVTAVAALDGWAQLAVIAAAVVVAIAGIVIFREEIRMRLRGMVDRR